jgi:hypothetical protein
MYAALSRVLHEVALDRCHCSIFKYDTIFKMSQIPFTATGTVLEEQLTFECVAL